MASRRIHDFIQLIAPVFILCCAQSTSCKPQDNPSKESPDQTKNDSEEVVIYCSVDTAFAEPILAAFEKKSGITVHRQYDTEAGKTTGLVNRILAERQRPRADVWWSGELFGTLQLAEADALDAYRPTHADEIPATFVDTNDHWTAFGLRGRVIAYDPDRVQPDSLPQYWRDLTDPRYKGRFAMADPRFGTTRGHMATLLSIWGKQAMTKFYQGLKDNDCRIADGNSHAVMLVRRGVVDFCVTDTDDVIVAAAQGANLDMSFPELNPPNSSLQLRALWIPASVAMIKGARNPIAAKKLIDYLTAANIEEALAHSDSNNIPVRATLRNKLIQESPDDYPGILCHVYEQTAAEINYEAVAQVLAESDALVQSVLLQSP